MKDNLGIFGSAEDNTGEYNVEELREALKGTPVAPPQSARLARGHGKTRRARAIETKRRKKRKFRSTIVAVVVLSVIAAGLVFLIRYWSTKEPPPPADYAGAGTNETVVKVGGGDRLSDIANSLLDHKVIASAEAFIAAAQVDNKLAAIQPGYYKVREGASAASTVDALLATENRVGQVELIPGNTLADTTVVKTGEVLPGYVTQLTAAACVPLNGVSTCFTADQLWEVVRNAPVEQLGLVDWAVDRVRASTDPSRRLEGMIFPGVYDVPPTDDPAEVLNAVISSSAVSWNTTTISTKAKQLGMAPYDLAVIASLVEREAITADMPQVARVIDNRLAIGMDLQLDSTVNYGLAESQIATSDAARADASNLYNTYVHPGLPPTPIGGVGPDALTATLTPADGPWLFFVKIDLTGKSCFTVTLEEHQRCVEQARANGVFG